MGHYQFCRNKLYSGGGGLKADASRASQRGNVWICPREIFGHIGEGAGENKIFLVNGGHNSDKWLPHSFHEQ